MGRLTERNAGAAEMKDYNYSDPTFSEQTGHFTQLVWGSTSSVGCGARLCGTKGWYLVCEYWPRGNVVGDFGKQVHHQVNGSSWTNTTEHGRYVMFLSFSYLCSG